MAKKYEYQRFSADDGPDVICKWIEKNLTENDHVISIVHEVSKYTGNVYKIVYYYTDDKENKG